jgi:hypothetical protein
LVKFNTLSSIHLSSVYSFIRSSILLFINSYIHPSLNNKLNFLIFFFNQKNISILGNKQKLKSVIQNVNFFTVFKTSLLCSYLFVLAWMTTCLSNKLQDALR